MTSAPSVATSARPASPLAAASAPIGPTLTATGVNFSVYSRHAAAVELLLFADEAADRPDRTVRLDPRNDRTGGYWHVEVPGVTAGQVYAYRATGPWVPEHGLRFDDRRLLIDPYGRGVAVPAGYAREVGEPTPGLAGRSMKSVVIDTAAYDWHGDRPLGRPFRDSVIYEAHVRGFTANPNSGVAEARRGTYAGFIERIPYLVNLGISAVELLPVFQFDALAAPLGRPNYWGYQPVSYFAPHAAYSSRPGAVGAVDEFRDLVRALHAAGLEVILDVVYNHTAETGSDGPTFAYRGLADDQYYILDEANGTYEDYSGTGNTLNANQSIVRRMILDSLRYWVQEMHVDGFRFDLASVLSRDEAGQPLARPPILWDIDSDPVLAGTKLIAEAWDAAGLYQVGSFVGDHWVEWNGRFRDDVRSFVKSDPGRVAALGQRLLGSPDVYARLGREPQKSINFVTCHDGFTLEDLVSYDTKHNEANGEENRDGSDQNESWNCGVEGPTDDPAVDELRRRQIKNLLTLDIVAVGVPMITMGDEVRRTQLGNNNGYCQDSELTWFDWSGVARNAEILRFTRRLIAGRRQLRNLFDLPAGLSLTEVLEQATITWHGVEVGQPDFSEDSRSIALTITAPDLALHLILNAYWEPLDFALPPTSLAHSGWQRLIDTSLAPPDDIVDPGVAVPVEGDRYHSGPRSTVVLGAGAITARETTP